MIDLAATFVRTDVGFLSDRQWCRAWHYRPLQHESYPLVIMAHGFAAERSFQLPYFARSFAQAGLGVLLFDYRHFGDSEGQPRNLVSHPRQLRDWQAALSFAETLPGVDATRMGLWSTSFGAGHALITAARSQDIAALVLMCPLVDMVRSIWRHPSFAFKALTHGLVDVAQSAVGLGRHYIPVVGDPGTFAVMNKPGCREGYFSLLPPEHDWQNRCPASVFVESAFYRPIRWAPRVQCPALVINAEPDELSPRRSVTRLASLLPHGRLEDIYTDHFGVYGGECGEKAMSLAREFFCQHLRPMQQTTSHELTASRRAS